MSNKAACIECHDVPEASMLSCVTCKRAPVCQQCAYNHLDHNLAPIGPLVPNAVVVDDRRARIMAAAERFLSSKGGR